MKEKVQAPELRFDGFTDDWEERKLGDEVRIVMGQSPNSENYTDDPNDYILVQGNADMKNGRVFPRVWTTQVTKQAEKDDLILSVRAPVGDIGKTAYDVVIGRGVAAIKGNEFIFQNLGKMKSDGYWTRYSTGSTFESINSTDIKEAIISVPTIEEQNKIGSFFKQLDNTIALHQRKLNLLKEQKKGYLQKMFPKNGAKVPELRFAGFADDWEERKFKDIIEKLTGGASIKPSDYLEEGIRTIPKGAVNSTGLADLSGSKYISEEFYESNKSSHVSTNNLVTSLRDLVPSAPNMGRIVRIAGEDEDFLMPQGVYKLELFDGVDEEFLIAFSNSDKYRKIISSEKNGSTQVHIRNGEFLNIDIELPFSEEQKQIGSFFKQLDNSIALHQRKLDLLKEQKKGFLEKMFV